MQEKCFSPFHRHYQYVFKMNGMNIRNTAQLLIVAEPKEDERSAVSSQAT